MTDIDAADLCSSAFSVGIFGVPLDVCAQSMYRAIKAVAEEVSNLSLREIHLVNINPQTTQFIQSVFTQLTSPSSASSEKPPSAVPEPQMPSSAADVSPSTVREKDEKVKDEGHEEVLGLYPANVHTPALETSPDETSTSDEEVSEDEHLLVAADDPQTGSDQQDETSLDREQMEQQESVVEQYQHLSSDDPDTVESCDDDFTQEQKSLAHSWQLMDQGDRKSSNKVLVMKKVLVTQDEDNQTFDVNISGESDQENFANSEPLVDEENKKSTDKVPHDGVSNTTEKDRQTVEKASGVKDPETGKMADDEEHRCPSSKPKPQLEMFMQELSLEEYSEGTPSGHREPTPVVPLDLPEDVSRRQKNSGPCSLEFSEQNHSREDRELYYSLPVDIADQADQQ